MMKPFETGTSLPAIAELPEVVWLWVAKGMGAVLGSAISLAYVLPKGRREAAIRFLVGLGFGVLFGTLAGAKLVDWLGVAADLSRIETVLVGSALASLGAWSALGAINRYIENRAGRQQPPTCEDKDRSSA